MGNVNWVGEVYLTGSGIHNGNLACEFLKPHLVTLFLLDKDHIGELLLRIGVDFGLVVDQRIAIFIDLVFPRGAGRNRHRAGEHNQS